jgi:hypothetical protein
MDPRDLREAFTAQIPDDHRWDARPKVKFVTDSPLEGAVRSEPVSEISPFRAILDGNKLILALKIAQNLKHGSRSA